MKTSKNRILEFIQSSGLSQGEFIRKCGLSKGAIANIQDTPNGTTLIKISHAYPELSLDWLLLGQGEMLRSSITDNNTLTVEVDETAPQKPKKRYTDDMSVQERLELFIKSKGLGNYQFEMKVGLSQGYIKRVRNCLHPEKIKRIANAFPDLNIEWMIIGRGEMTVNTSNSLYENEIHKLLKEQNTLQQDIINRLKIELKEVKNERIALEKENKRLVKSLTDMAALYTEQISTKLAEIDSRLIA